MKNVFTILISAVSILFTVSVSFAAEPSTQCVSRALNTSGVINFQIIETQAKNADSSMIKKLKKCGIEQGDIHILSCVVGHECSSGAPCSKGGVCCNAPGCYQNQNDQCICL